MTGKHRKKRRRKILLITPLTVVALLAILLMVVAAYRNPIAKAATEKVLSSVLGVPVTVGKMSISPFGGSIDIHDCVIGNPEGFYTDSAMSFGRVHVRANIKSFTSSEIVIHEITMEDSQITLESSLTRLNIGVILKNTEKEPEEEEEEKEKEEKEPEEEAAKKKVVIDVLTIDKAKIRLATTLIKKRALHLSLSKIEMKDIGREKDSSVVDVVRELLINILVAVRNEAGPSLSKDVGSALKDTGNAVGRKMEEGGKTIGESLGKGADTAEDGWRGLGDSIRAILGGKKKDENRE